MRTKEETRKNVKGEYIVKFQSASFANKGRNTHPDMDDDAILTWFQSASFANKGRNTT
ncbi:hypothetical protein LEP1GSC008_3498 [Leptospira kirschneri serovar Bulgarica str. Nikolaevo]|uniref:Uncharacterized protein n=1 Tax=Leptospira kirschneri serovar Bulgarica str. Nikolaevo TaxID=1240687 RepID=M6F1K9_9LEPT|nr:hypothetical protein LEP1GSC008_3498 [Leptospira kirschneri serovar Bulgarica str. Nikolaevo]